jgi:hypothetical protein
MPIKISAASKTKTSTASRRVVCAGFKETSSLQMALHARPFTHGLAA